jgi:hypothetical protein
MKRIVCFIFLVILMSCGTKPEAEEHRIRIEFRNSVSHEYHLLSVRDSGLLVVAGYDKIDDSPQFISFSRIKNTYYYTGGKSTGMLLGGLIGCTAGAGTVIAIGLSQPPGVIQGGEGVAVGAAFIGLIAIAPGMIIGYLVTSDEKTFDISNTYDRDKLRFYARYPDIEPPELQKIK